MRLFFISCIILLFSLESYGNPLEYAAINVQKENSTTNNERSFLQKMLLLPLSFYTQISAANGPDCPSLPSCSTYARQAIIKHGAVLGGLMTVDRLIHEHSEVDLGLRLNRQTDGRTFVLDSLTMNDFWLFRKN